MWCARCKLFSKPCHRVMHGHVRSMSFDQFALLNPPPAVLRQVLIQDGYLLEGTLCKRTLGASGGSLIHIIFMEAGPEVHCCSWISTSLPKSSTPISHVQQIAQLRRCEVVLNCPCAPMSCALGRLELAVSALQSAPPRVARVWPNSLTDGHMIRMGPELKPSFAGGAGVPLAVPVRCKLLDAAARLLHWHWCAFPTPCKRLESAFWALLLQLACLASQRTHHVRRISAGCR